MSLIQEALKRQQEESAQALAGQKPSVSGIAVKTRPQKPIAEPPPADAADTPSTPPGTQPGSAAALQPAMPPPLPGQSPAPSKLAVKEQPAETPVPQEEPEISPDERKALSTVAVVVIVIVVLLMVGVSALYIAFTKMKTGLPQKTAALQTSSVPQKVAIATQAIPVKAAAQQPASTQKVAVVAATNVPPAPIIEPPKFVKPPPPPPPPPEWPTLKLTAILGKGARGAARINGQTVLVGESVEGVTLVEINEQNVLLEFNGKRETLRIGATLH